MLARVQSFILQGIDAAACEVEVDIDEAGVGKHPIMVGLPDTAVRESLERVRSAIANAGYRFPRGALVVNLAPADVRKEGPVFDLPIAVGLLMADGSVGAMRARGRMAVAVGADAVPDRVGIRVNGECLPEGLGQSLGAFFDSESEASDGCTDDADGRITEPLDVRRTLFAGELALDGRLRPIRGALAMAALARHSGARAIMLPQENAQEAAVVSGIDVIGVSTLAEVVGILNGAIEARAHPPVNVAELIEQSTVEVDFAEVRGQESVKRAITVAGAGGHNILMLGPAGTGKTMMAKAFPGILPTLSVEEALEVTRIYSAVGQVPTTGARGLVTVRPVRSPHHTASAIAVIGGGTVPKPGEISLAHKGVLFLDELPEFPRAVLDTLRQPLEDGTVTIARAHSAVTFPANFMLVAAMNPTAKGDMPNTPSGMREMERYLGRVSRPLIDRIDIHVEAPAVPWKDLASRRGPSGLSSAEMRERIAKARERQQRRQGVLLNARLRGRHLDELAPMGDDAKALLGQAITELGLSARAYDKIRRVARSIADLESSDGVELGHVAEAVQYRLLDRKV